MADQWFIRDNAQSSLVSVLSYYEAEIVARARSKTNATGIIEVVTTRSWDNQTFVVGIFLRGRKLQRGARARESSRLGLPPKV